MAVEDVSNDITVAQQQHYHERQEFALKVENLQREHELRMAKLKAIEAGRVKAGYRRTEVFERVAIALLKSPVLLVLALVLPVLLLAGREVPGFLQSFFSL